MANVNSGDEEFFKTPVSNWDPFSTEWTEKPTVLCLSRIKRDISVMMTDPSPLIFVFPDEDDITKIHALISGPADTPYEGGFFYFFIRIPPTYPMSPPLVKLMTTGNGSVRFNPNFYNNGKVCLSSLGTWFGPKWTAAHSLSSLLMSIQSLMNKEPYINEPGFCKMQGTRESMLYNEYVKHETLRVAVCEILQVSENIPILITKFIEKVFLSSFDFYFNLISESMNCDGQSISTVFHPAECTANYKQLLSRILDIKKKLEANQ